MRDSIRALILDSKNAAPSSRLITFLGAEIEVRQPTLDGITKMTEMKENQGLSDATAMLIFYAFVPGTNERVFEEGDIEFLKNLPFSHDVATFITAVGEMSNIDLQVKVATKNSEETDSASGQ